MLTVDQARKCYDEFQKQGIWDDNEEVFKKNFLKWSLKNHPDKNLNNQMITELYQTVSGCKSDFLENFLQYAFVAKNDVSIEQQKQQSYDPLETIPCPYCGMMLQRNMMGMHIMTTHVGNHKYAKKAKKAKSAPKKSKKSKAKKAKSAPKKSKKSKKSKAKKAKSAPRKSKKSKAKKAKSAPKKSKKSKAKKTKSVPKKSKKSKAKKTKSAPKKSKAKKTKSAPRKSKKSKAKKAKSAKKSKKSKSKKSKTKKQKGGKPATSPYEFKKKMESKKKKPSPLRNEIKAEEPIIIRLPGKRLKIDHTRSKSVPTQETAEWDFS